jgi:hypothetical protein
MAAAVVWVDQKLLSGAFTITVRLEPVPPPMELLRGRNEDMGYRLLNDPIVGRFPAELEADRR